MEKEPAIVTNPHDPHVTDEEMLAYAENNLAGQDRDRVRRHLHACAQCFDAYQDSILLRGMWATDEPAFAPSKDLVDAGKQLAVGRTAYTEESSPRARTRAGVFGFRPLGIAAKCAAVILIAAIWLLRPDEVSRIGDAALNSTILQPLRSAVETVSMRGPFVLPGGEHYLDQTSSAYRSGFVPLSDSLESSLRYLDRKFQEGNNSPDLTYWLIGGYVASGQIDAARDFLSHPRVLSLEDSRIFILKAIVAYMDQEYSQAESLLRDLLAENPHDPIASINLAIVLHEQENDEECRTILNRIARDYAGTPLAIRAQLILNRQKDLDQTGDSSR